jgi:hypothetical protein
MSRLVQAANRFDGVMRRRMSRLAGLVSEGMPINLAGEKMGLTKGQLARAWANIKSDLGEQAR